MRSGPDPVSLILLGVAGVVAAVVATVFFLVRRQKAFVAGLAGALYGTVRGSAISGNRGGSPFVCRFVPGGKNTPPALKVGLDCRLPGRLTVSREHAGHRLAKGIGLAREIQTGDPDFDRRYYLDADDAGFASRLTADPAVRECVRQAFAMSENLRELAFRPDGMTARLSPIDTGQPAAVGLAAGRLLDLLADLSRMAGRLDGGIPGGRVAAAGLGWPLLAFLIVPPVVAAVAGLLGLVIGYEIYPPLDRSAPLADLRWSLPVAAVWTALAFGLLRGRSSSGTWFLLVAVLAAVGGGVIGPGGMVWSNGALDGGGVETKTMTIERKSVSHRKNHTVHRLHLSDPGSPGALRPLTVERGLFEEVKPGMPLQLGIMPGRWGVPWVVSVAPGSPPPLRP